MNRTEQKIIRAMKVYSRFFRHGGVRGDGYWRDPLMVQPQILYSNWYRATPTVENYKRLEFVCNKQVDGFSFETWFNRGITR